MFNIETKLEWCLITDKHIHQPQWAKHQKISVKLERADVYAMQRAFVLYTQCQEDVVVGGQYSVTASPMHSNGQNATGYSPETSAPKLVYSGVRMFFQHSTRTFIMQVWEDGEWGVVVAEFAISQVQFEIVQANRYLLGHSALPDDAFRESECPNLTNPMNCRVVISQLSFLDSIPLITKAGDTTMVMRTHQRSLGATQLPHLHMYVRHEFEDSAIWWPTPDLSGGEMRKYNDVSVF